VADIVRDLWILTEDGLTIFSQVINPKIDHQVFGGLMSALNMFAETLSNDGMSNFELSSIRFTIEKKDHLIFVATSSNDVKPKKIMKELKIISKKFFQTYPKEIIDNWSTNIAAFRDFNKHITDSFAEMT
jgi:hypothetical protein